ncbi:MAG: hypothetical protein PVH61_00730 [Candidatus Aminicenantes bacterium]
MKFKCFIHHIKGFKNGVPPVPLHCRVITIKMNGPGMIFFYLNGIKKVNGLKNGFKIVISVCPFADDFQAQVDFCKGFQFNH